MCSCYLYLQCEVLIYVYKLFQFSLFENLIYSDVFFFFVYLEFSQLPFGFQIYFFYLRFNQTVFSFGSSFSNVKSAHPEAQLSSAVLLLSVSEKLLSVRRRE